MDLGCGVWGPLSPLQMLEAAAHAAAPLFDPTQGIAEGTRPKSPVDANLGVPVPAGKPLRADPAVIESTICSTIHIA